MGVQRQQERWAFLYNAHPCMPVPVDASLVSFGLPKPTLQSHVILEAWSCVSPHKESCGTAGHHPRHGAAKWGVEAGELLVPARALWAWRSVAEPFAQVRVAATRSISCPC